MKKTVLLATIAFAIYFIATRPSNAAVVAKGLTHDLGVVAASLAEALTKVFK